MKIHKTGINWLLVFMVFIVCVPILLLATKAYAATEKSIRVVMDNNYPPYSFKDSEGKLQGITIDQWKLFSAKTGIKVEITGMPWSKAFDSMKQGKFDVIDTISYNSERDKIFDFTKPYATIDVQIFFHKNISGITGAESLKGFTVGAKRSDNAINELKKKGVTSIKAYNSAEDVVKAAKNQEIVTFVMGKPPALYYMYKLGIADKFNYSTSLYTSHFYRAVKQGNTELLNSLNKGFGEISDGDYKKIQNKWFGNTNSQIYNTVFYRAIIIIIAIVVFVVLLLLLWNTTLHIKVKEKTKDLSFTIKELKTSEARIRALLEAIPDMFFYLDNEGRIIDFHAMEVDKLFMKPDNFLNKTIEEIFPRKLSKLFIAAIKKTLELENMQTIEYDMMIDDKRLDFEARLVACSKDSVVGIVRDITERKLAEEKLIEISTHDALTGLFNRYYFESEISKLQNESLNSLCLAVFDLDGLKLVNDTMGHAVGDQYLIAAAGFIGHAFPKDSIMARIGGDEFSVLVINKSKKEVDGYIKLLNEEIDKFRQINGIFQTSISFGYVFSEGSNINILEMMREADNRMYRVKLHRRQSMKSEVVQTMKNMLEARDFITEGHASRMEELAVNLALAIGMQEKDVSDIRLLAQFHDIGKVGIPDHILFKPSKLDNEEFEIMKRHTEIGHRIAESSADLMPIAGSILKHHEYWDGKGYPFGIRGEEIPIECRILSIVDAYDAMTNDRPYRKAMTKEAGLNELRRCSGTQFDPLLVEEFLKLMN